ncbi:MAG: RsmD family RNA methyltransferase, partial [Bacteroidia bacterium]|nr:RsmD family RNA methyltransferase [Bacteroidia bacterium]
MGIDDIALSKQFKEVVSVELNNELNNISIFNFNQLQIDNIDRITISAEEYLKQSNDHFDLIYIDPDRRSEEKRQILLSEHQPNIVELLPQLLNISNKVAIKTSPLYDHNVALQELSNITDLIAISRFGEMKEMLILCSNNPSLVEPKITCVDIGEMIVLEEFTSQNNYSNAAETLE